VGSDAMVVVQSTGSSTTVVAASKRWVSAPEVAAFASEFGGATFALASTTSSSVVA
jgi:hypothetical protein